MKKVIGIAIVALPFLTQGQASGFSIEGKVGVLDKPAKAYLYYESGGVYIYDSAMLQKGVFHFKGNIDQPYRGSIILDE